MLCKFLCVIGLLMLYFVACSGEMAEQATEQIVAICCRCKPLFLLLYSDKMHITVASSSRILFLVRR